MVQRIDLLNPPEDSDPPQELTKECPRCGRKWSRVEWLYGRPNCYFHPSGWRLACNWCHAAYLATDPVPRPPSVFATLQQFVRELFTDDDD